MAKKTESTAVNDLINLVATQGPSVKDPGADLFAEAPKKTARVTGTVPPVNSAGSVDPLPRTRAPAGTQQNASINVAPADVPPVRTSTVMPRASSIPPLPDSRARPALPPPRSSSTMPRPPIPSSAKIAVPPPAPAIEPDLEVDLSDDDDEADLLKTPVAAQPRAVLAPPPVKSSAGLAVPPLPTSSAGLAVPPTKSSAALAVPPPMPRSSAAIAVPAAAPLPVVSAPLTLPPEPVYPRAERDDHPNARPSAADMTGAAPWFDDSHAVDRLSDASHSMTESTAQVQRNRAGTLELLKKLALPMAVAIVLGVFVGGYIVFDGQGGKKRDAAVATAPVVANAATTDDSAAPAVAPPIAAEPAAPVAPEPVATPTAAEPTAAPTEATEPAAKAEPVAAAAAPAVAAPAVAEPAKADPSVLGSAVASMPAPAPAAAKIAKPTFVDVRIDSSPSGATVMLVDRGKTSFLGTTPISASVDPTRTYEVVLTYANKPTQVERLDPKATTHLAITLGKAAKATQPKAMTQVETPKAEKKVATQVAATKPAANPADDTEALARKLAEKKKAAKTETTAPAEVEKAVAKPAAKATGAGVLMISSKPPCEIWVDGASTGLMTPQRSMSLPAGKHKITLVSPDKAHKKTVAVEITPDKPTKVIQDLLN